MTCRFVGIALLLVSLATGCGNSGTLSESGAREKAASFANKALEKTMGTDAAGMPVKPMKLTAKTWKEVVQKDGRWIATFDPPAGWHVVVSFNLDGTDAQLETGEFRTHK